MNSMISDVVSNIKDQISNQVDKLYVWPKRTIQYVQHNIRFLCQADMLTKVGISLYLLKILLFVCVIIGLLVVFYIGYHRVKSNFWSRQPVMHTFDIWNVWKKNGIIDEGPIKPNQFFDIEHVHAVPIATNHKLLKRLVPFLTENFVSNYESATYTPTYHMLRSQFTTDIQSPSLLTTYVDNLKNDTTTCLQKDDAPKHILGCMLSRPIHIFLPNIPKMMVYYIDHLCVDKGHRRKNIAPTIIQTCYHYQRMYNPHAYVALFKREGDLTDIIPLTYYDSYYYNVQNHVNYNFELQTHWNFTITTSSTFPSIYHFVSENMKRYECCILASQTNVLQQIKSKNIRIIACHYGKHIVGLFIFADNNISQNGKHIIELIASIPAAENRDIDIETVWIKLFFSSLMFLNKKGGKHYDTVCLENIGDNTILQQCLSQKYHKIKPTYITKTAYYLYNYRHQPIDSKNCLIIT